MVAITNFILITLFAFIPSIVWLIFFLKEDLHPEPKRLIVFVFCAGALASIPALVLQLVFQKFVAQPLDAFLLLILGIAIIEEIFKFFAAYLSVKNEAAFNEPVDAMIYAIAAALGFATIENLFVIGDKMYYLTLGNIMASFSVLGFRFIGATLLHGLTSALAGYYWALGRKFGKNKRFISLGLAAASAVHFFFNFAVYKFENTNLFYPSLFLIFIAFFVLKDFSKLKSAK
ncbi:MAG: PrsW family glutamic-type intramembrane protease [Minisyncoccia bacterium]